MRRHTKLPFPMFDAVRRERTRPEISWLNAIIARVSINYVAVFKWPVPDRATVRNLSRRGPPYCHGVARCPTKRRLVIDLVSLTTFIIFHRSVLWRRVKRVEIGTECRELESIFREFFFFFLHATFLDERMWFLFFFFQGKRKKRKRFTWNSCTHSRCFFAVKFSLECLAHVRAYRDRVRSRAMENPQMYLFFIFFFYYFLSSFFFFCPGCESNSLQGCD